ncbi:rod shape-determining protein MreD [Nonomuraea sp. NPDC059007]|uniref:rod shape-determining protein MreD n=1 Tax=Nonomuraea sp. NPDC059007 TaxID=3346692 RepID=UPI0036773980
MPARAWAAVALAPLIQVVLVNRLSLPGGVTPDLTLLAVLAAARLRGPVAGAVAGFAAGAVLDLIPPAVHPVGRDALALCLAGYVAGHLLRLPAVAAFPLGVLAGLLFTAGVHAALGDPRAGGPALVHVLPLAAAYTVAASPLVWFPMRWKAPDAFPAAGPARADRLLAAHPAHPAVGRAGAPRRRLRQGRGGRSRQAGGRAAGQGRDPR